MRWWCSAGAGAWTWTPVAYPGVWLVVALVAVVYWRLSRGTGTPRGARWAGWLGVAVLDAALDWPVGSLAAGYLASAHALQFLLVVLIAPPLLLIGVRRGVEQRWPRDPSRRRLLSTVLNPLAGAIAFNAIIVATHVPRVNDTLMASQLGAFAIDLAWLIAGLWFWWPLDRAGAGPAAVRGPAAHALFLPRDDGPYRRRRSSCWSPTTPSTGSTNLRRARPGCRR